MIAELVTLTAGDTGYTLYALLQAAYVAASANPNQVPLRACSITIQPVGSTANFYIVPNAGAYTATLGVPARYGYDFGVSGTYFEKIAIENILSLGEIVLGTDTAGAKMAVTVYVK